MVDNVDVCNSGSLYFPCNPSNTGIVVCMNCYKLEHKLKEVFSELSSAKLIIKLLQEESQKLVVPGHVSNTAYNACTEPHENCGKLDNNDWTTVTSNGYNSSNIYGNHVNSLNQPIKTSNRFTPLTTVNETNVSVHNSANENGEINESDGLKNHNLTPNKGNVVHLNSPTSVHNLQVNKGRYKTIQSAEKKLTYGIPTIINGQISLGSSNKMMTCNSTNYKILGSELLVNLCCKNYKQEKDHNIGDSHSTGCAVKLKNHLNDNCAVQGLVKSGACTDILVESAMNVTKELTKKDVLVLWSGSNDVARNTL
jgi:hypothetical protein